MLPEITAGRTVAALALAENAYHWPTDDYRTRAATNNGATYQLTGSKRFVIDACNADELYVAACVEDDAGLTGLFKVDREASSVAITELHSLDTTRRCADVTFENTPATLIGDPSLTTAGLRQTLQVGCIALANEMVGGAAYLLDATLAYVDLRMQFGRKIGSFQSVKHKCADMLLELELAKSTAYVAAATYAEDPEHPDLPMLAAMTKANAADTYAYIAAEAIQLHGGIGFTWDNDIHFWYRRAKSSELLLGDAAYHREQMMQNLPTQNTTQRHAS